MLPLGLFRVRQFTAANLVTAAVYAALGGTFFLLAVQLQNALGYSPTEAGAALLPITLLMLALSPRAGALSQRIGPRFPMTAGPVLVALALLLMLRIEPGAHYVTDVLPAVIVFGLGLSLTVAPLTATVLGAAPVEHAGMASAVNNAVARVAGLIAIAVLPTAAGLTAADLLEPDQLTDDFHVAMVIAAVLTLAGAVTAAVGIRNPERVVPQPAAPRHCAVDGPPLRVSGATGGAK
jgi:MFS family permease